MKTKLCPLCDQPMKQRHYCGSCRSFVWKPVVLDIHYDTEYMEGEDCSYHSQEHTYVVEKDDSVRMESESNRSSRKRRKKSKKKKGCFLPLIPILFVVITIVSNLISIGRDIMNEMGIYEVVDEECSEYNHMNWTYHELLPVFEEMLQEMTGKETVAFEENLYEYMGEDHAYTFVEHIIYLDDEGEEYVCVDSDGSSQRVHEISFCVESLDRADFLLDHILFELGLEGQTIEFYSDLAKENDGYIFECLNSGTLEYELYVNVTENDGDIEYYISIEAYSF